MWLPSKYLDGMTYVAMAPIRAIAGFAKGAMEIKEATGELVVQQHEKLLTDFEKLERQRKFKPTGDNLVLLNNFLASNQGTDEQKAKAKRMLQKVSNYLGVKVATWSDIK